METETTLRINRILGSENLFKNNREIDSNNFEPIDPLYSELGRDSDILFQKS